MKFDKRHKPHESAAREESRYAITHALFERDDDGARLVTTNGRVLSVVPVTEAEGDVPGLVSREALKAATKGRTKAQPDAQLMLPDDKRELAHIKGGLVESERPTDLQFPDYRAVMPKPETGLQITLSAEQLQNVIASLGVLGDDLDGITLKFVRRDDGNLDGGSPVLVEPIAHGNEAYAVIMPIDAE